MSCYAVCVYDASHIKEVTVLQLYNYSTGLLFARHSNHKCQEYLSADEGIITLKGAKINDILEMDQLQTILFY